MFISTVAKESKTSKNVLYNSLMVNLRIWMKWVISRKIKYLSDLKGCKKLSYTKNYKKKLECCKKTTPPNKTPHGKEIMVNWFS